MVLLDTNICTYYLKGKYFLDQKLSKITKQNRFISEITLAELKFGIQNSQNPVKNGESLDKFLGEVNVLPNLPTIDFYAGEKARLRKLGTPVDDFDLLIGSCAVLNGLCLVTNNESHFQRINGIVIEIWVK